MLIINKHLDADGTRWIEPVAGLKLKVGSTSNHGFKSRTALVRRHIDKLDSLFKAGTTDFSLDAVGDIDSMDDLLLETCSRHLLLDWDGVGEVVNGKEQAIPYTPEAGLAFLQQNPEFYWTIIQTGAEIAAGKEERKQDAVGK
ncbi:MULTISPECIES: hypothetical protein [unclassified Tatumella]|uniref:Uncharacterized protein n=1 Tax=Tatumella punctata TaxID=399969 RepID=A0ABW1VSM0_9GAMM|nr:MULTISPECIES: hypothetical protein [unclassified Tatumella]MBS0855989.1 hypothetical protein [Tatumella sp. JGM16]MBS0878607.1 hypothetical protein [Tatumella sp. JGM82]MBS0892183.1 hypothetical protein [Tatumella sp. JGM94]MBS0895510.1 hypothetical protein [Tatumella sp. JGM130]MBS0903313.1 hypothetical protein [Tatumella sp. JGM100]